MKKDFIKSHRTDFEEIEKKILREICAESRQKIWINSPNTIFKVGDKEYKKVENQEKHQKPPAKKKKVVDENRSPLQTSSLSNNNTSSQPAVFNFHNNRP